MRQASHGGRGRAGLVGRLADAPDRRRREDQDARNRLDGGRQALVQTIKVRPEVLKETFYWMQHISVQFLRIFL